MNEILKRIYKLDLDPNDFAIFGSSPMVARGLKKFHNDIDIIARGESWERATKEGIVKPSKMYGHVVRLFSGEIEIFDTWISEGWDVDKLIDTADIIDGIKFVKLDYVLEYKRILHRAKDIKDIQDIEKYIELHNNFIYKNKLNFYKFVNDMKCDLVVK